LRLNVTAGSCVVETHGAGHGGELRESAQRLMSIFMSTFAEMGPHSRRTTPGRRRARHEEQRHRHPQLRDLLKRGDLVNRGSDDRPRYYPSEMNPEP
jgi:hypothetical protein